MIIKQNKAVLFIFPMWDTQSKNFKTGQTSGLSLQLIDTNYSTILETFTFSSPVGNEISEMGSTGVYYVEIPSSYFDTSGFYTARWVCTITDSEDGFVETVYISQKDIDSLNDVSTSEVNTESLNALNTYDAPTKAELDSVESNLTTEINNNETKIDNVQTLINNLNDISVSDIWSYTTRTLSSFGTLISDIWNNVTRTLTAGTKDSEIDSIKTTVDNLEHVQFGKWIINKNTNVLTLYKQDGTTLLKEFDLTDDSNESKREPK